MYLFAGAWLRVVPDRFADTNTTRVSDWLPGGQFNVSLGQGARRREGAWDGAWKGPGEAAHLTSTAAKKGKEIDFWTFFFSHFSYCFFRPPSRQGTWHDTGLDRVRLNGILRTIQPHLFFLLSLAPPFSNPTNSHRPISQPVANRQQQSQGLILPLFFSLSSSLSLWEFAARRASSLAPFSTLLPSPSVANKHIHNGRYPGPARASG